MFLAPWFAVAGLVAAAGTVLIHLLHRRRFRTVPWAAMDFLREAVRRSRRIFQLRDLLLLILRTACVLLFGLALARPFWSGRTADPDEPVHAIVLVDNSLSMGYQEPEGTLLDAAKQAARRWIERLPSGSRTTVVPLCGSSGALPADVCATKDDALEVLAAVEVVDRASTLPAAVDAALEACRRVVDPPRKRLLLVADPQLLGRPTEALAPQLARLPAPIQTIQLAARDPENAWVEQFRLQDDLADLATSATFLGTIRYQGQRPRSDVQVVLSVDGLVAASTTVDLVPGQAREVRFEGYRFQVPAQPGRPTWVRAELSLPPDRLPADDRRCLVVPVVAALPVVFVDQYGQDEDPRRNRYGETWPLRRLLAPVTSREDAAERLVRSRRATVDRVDRELLADARLVVVAGVSSPGPAVAPLREYVLGGGQLIVAAGGEFDPAAWNQAAWLDGQGILPVPLLPDLIGRPPDQARAGPVSFQLDPDSLVHDSFRLEHVSREELEDLYRLPFFFQAVQADVREPPAVPAAASGGRPRVLARFAGGQPYLVERPMGAGRALLVTSGFSTPWSTLGLTNTMLVFDRIVRGMLQETFPPRNLSTDGQILLDVAAAERAGRFTLRGPGRFEQALAVEAIGPERYGLWVRSPAHRGQYSVSMAADGDAASSGLEMKVWEVPLAVNGPAEESSLATADAPGSGQPAGTAAEGPLASGLLAPDGQTVSQQQGLWKWLLWTVLVLLVVEMTVLAAPMVRKEPAT